jgi:hypothetical protein
MRGAGGGARTTPLVDRYHLCFALGKALEDRGDYAESFRYYERGNALKNPRAAIGRSSIERNARLQASVCTREFFAARRLGCPSAEPIFIVGLPRSGSTLLEQILASHSQVEGTHGAADMPRIVGELQRPRAGRRAALSGDARELEAPRISAAGREIPRRYARSSARGKPHFIDKMPNNFRHIGLIHLMLPNAKIIDARREPMACCFSNFKQLFAAGQEFTYSIEDIARYYRSYVELMESLGRGAAGQGLRISTRTPLWSRTSRATCGACSISAASSFEPACLEFHKTERSVRTASSEQVRRPIFARDLDQWRHFEPWLGPLKIYEWPPLALFLARVIAQAALFCMSDPLARVNVMEYRPGEALNWHFDRSQFTTTLADTGRRARRRIRVSQQLRSDSGPELRRRRTAVARRRSEHPRQPARGRHLERVRGQEHACIASRRSAAIATGWSPCSRTTRSRT